MNATQNKNEQHGCSSRENEWIDDLLIEELPPRKMRLLREHLTGCSSCQKRYNRAILASRLLEGGPDALELPSHREIDRIGEAVLERARLVPDSTPVRRGVLRWVMGFAASAAVLAIALPIAYRTMDAPPRAPEAVGNPAMVNEFQARGAVDKEEVRVGFRALCIRKEPGLASGEPSIVGLTPASVTTQPSACQMDQILRFTYTNKSDLGFVFLLGLDEGFQIKWYEPHPPGQASIPIHRDVVDRTLDRAVRINVNHNNGLHRLFAIFSKRPILADQVKQAVAKVKASRAGLDKLDRLPLKNTSQRSLLVNLTRK